MKRYAQTQDEMAGILGISRRQFGKYASLPDAPQKVKSGYPVQRWQEFYKEQKEAGLKGDGSLRDEKTLREIRKLDVQIEQLQGELVNRREEETRYIAKMRRLRAVAESWRSHESAKHPEVADLIDALADRFCEQIARDGG